VILSSFDEQGNVLKDAHVEHAPESLFDRFRRWLGL
jgi:hypothetical protein